MYQGHLYNELFIVIDHLSESVAAAGTERAAEVGAHAPLVVHNIYIYMNI